MATYSELTTEETLKGKLKERRPTLKATLTNPSLLRSERGDYYWMTSAKRDQRHAGNLT